MIIFTKHAKDRMGERRISEKDVKTVLQNPGHIHRNNHRIIVQRKINKETIEVVYIVENNKRIILTCYYI